jgi:hypothetical protein
MIEQIRIASTALCSALVFCGCSVAASFLPNHRIAVWSFGENFAWALPISIACGVTIALIGNRKKAVPND